MAKKNNQKTSETDNANDKKSAISASLKPFLLISLIALILSALSIVAIHQFASEDIQQGAQQIHLQTVAESTANLTQTRFSYTSRQLENIAKSDLLIATISDEEADKSAIIELLQKSFNDSISLQIIPWDHTATVGLRERGIEMRNNIETLMLTRAGGDKIPPPEVYQHDKNWLISFAQPITVDGEVKAILFLSYDKQFFAGVVNNTFYKENAAITVQLNDKKAIASNGGSAINSPMLFDLPFTNGQLMIASAKSVGDVADTALLISYICIALSALLLIILAIAMFLVNKKALLHDIAAIVHHANSLQGLHRTKPPVLAFQELTDIVDSIQNLCNQTRSAVTPEAANAPQVTRKSTQKSAISNEPIAVAEAVIEENFPFSAPHIFRDYDIRGHADNELNDENVQWIAQAIASEAAANDITSIAVGRDGRLSGQRILNTLAQTLAASGIDVIDIGVIPTPVLYFAASQIDSQSGIMITASHNPAEDNGFKMVLAGKTLQGAQIKGLLKRIENRDLVESQHQGSITQQDFSAQYQSTIANDILIAKPMKIVIDAGNGVGGELAVKLFQQLNCEIIPLYCDIDGTFPNHAPDPSKEENLTDLCNEVVLNSADLGIALDGDADRLVAVTSLGDVISGDKLLMIFAEDVVSRNPASTVIYDIKCSQHLPSVIQQFGGKPLIWKAGHANIKAKMQETGAILGGELTGHYFFKERWFGFDDGIYSALRLVEILTNDNQSLDQKVSKFPSSYSLPEILIPVSDDKVKFDIVRQLQASLSSEKGEINKLDGIRIDYPSGWGLVRASNTRAALSARFEATTADELAKVQAVFKNALLAIDSSLSIPF